MHSYEGPGGRTYHHESEGSLEDVIHFEADGRYPEAHIYSDGRVRLEVTITMRDVLWLAARHVRSRAIDFYEQATDEEVLGQATQAQGSWDETGETWTGPVTLAAPIPPGGLDLGGWFTNPRDNVVGTEEPNER